MKRRIVRPYACTADQVNVVLADRPWRTLSPASVPVDGKLTWK
ncbi:MAG TPA: hypothetical protein VK532_02025 [Gaiellaceae bacterium]|jgi:hypothetical protein|nr:hypothetical protein [Gaiellaceae bacterium]